MARIASALEDIAGARWTCVVSALALGGLLTPVAASAYFVAAKSQREETACRGQRSPGAVSLRGSQPRR